MKYRSFLVIAGMAAFMPSAAHAATGIWTGNLTSVEQNSDNRVGAENIAALYFNAQFLGTTCPTNMAYFNATNNPHILSVAISAFLAGRNLRIVVDDSKPKWYGYCQIVGVRVE